jgi:hypothetical protein
VGERRQWGLGERRAGGIRLRFHGTHVSTPHLRHCACHRRTSTSHFPISAASPCIPSPPRYTIQRATRPLSPRTLCTHYSSGVPFLFPQSRSHHLHFDPTPLLALGRSASPFLEKEPRKQKGREEGGGEGEGILLLLEHRQNGGTHRACTSDIIVTDVS